MNEIAFTIFWATFNNNLHLRRFIIFLWGSSPKDLPSNPSEEAVAEGIPNISLTDWLRDRSEKQRHLCQDLWSYWRPIHGWTSQWRKYEKTNENQVFNFEILGCGSCKLHLPTGSWQKWCFHIFWGDLVFLTEASIFKEIYKGPALV